MVVGNYRQMTGSQSPQTVNRDLHVRTESHHLRILIQPLEGLVGLPGTQSLFGALPAYL